MTTLEHQGLRLKLQDNGDGTFTIIKFVMGGGAGVADSSLEIQGYRVLAHDNGDGTHSPTTTVSTGAGDVSVEFQGLRLKLHPTGGTVSIGGAVCSLYAIVIA